MDPTIWDIPEKLQGMERTGIGKTYHLFSQEHALHAANRIHQFLSESVQICRMGTISCSHPNDECYQQELYVHGEVGSPEVLVMTEGDIVPGLLRLKTICQSM